MRCCFLFLLLLALIPARMQGQTYQAILSAEDTRAPIPYAHVHAPAHDAHALTDEKGFFRLNLLFEADSLSLMISALGVKDSLKVPVKGAKIARLSITQPATRLEEVELKGLTAYQVVRQAVQAIPRLYASETYGAYGFYRQYQRVNQKYQNLIEAQVMLRTAPEAHKKQLKATEAFSIPFIRRSAYIPVPADGEYGDEIQWLMQQNPVYHLDVSSLHPGRLAQYRFRFDTITQDYYVIDYESDFWTSDPHGISNYTEANLTGEARETGSLKIDKESLAIIKFIRRVERNEKYDYPRLNNFVLPSRDYRIELVEGLFIAEYEPVGGIWYPKRLLHRFTNDYMSARMNRHAYRVEECFEWHPQALTRKLDPNWQSPFYDTPYLSALPYTYDAQAWEGTLPNFFFGIEELVHQDIREQAKDSTLFLIEGTINDAKGR